MSIKFSAIEEREVKQASSRSLLPPVITVFGVGGAGNNAINNMISLNLEGVRFVAGNTDMQALESCLSPTKVQLGKTITGGLGAGSHPEVGVRAAEEAEEEIKDAIKGSNMLFITAGMGGGTGTGASSIVAKIAREMDILTVGVVTRPFDFEGNQKSAIAKKGIEELLKYVDTLIVISNQMLFQLIQKDTSLQDSFKIIDEAMVSCIKSMADLMLSPGVINLDFNDIKFMIGDMGRALFSVSEAEGENRAQIVSEDIVKNPLIEDVELKGASKVLVNIAGSSNITLHEVDDIVNKIKLQLSEDAVINFGTVLDESLADKIKVSLVATGIKVNDNILEQEVETQGDYKVKHYNFEDNKEQLEQEEDYQDPSRGKIVRKTRYNSIVETDHTSKKQDVSYGKPNTVVANKGAVSVKSKKTANLSSGIASTKIASATKNKNIDNEEPRNNVDNKNYYSNNSSDRKDFFESSDSDSLFSRISSKNSVKGKNTSLKTFNDSSNKEKLNLHSGSRASSNTSSAHKDAFFDLPNFFKMKK